MNSSPGHESQPRANRHGWNSFDNYFSTHDAQLKRLGEFFVEEQGDCLMPQLIDAYTLQIVGTIWCHSNIFLNVNKVLEINERNQVRTIRYSYHAGVIVGGVTKNIFRYDNAHEFTREGHLDAHHKHLYSWETNQQTGAPEWIGEAKWPTLSEVLYELYDWWQETGKFLSLDEDPLCPRPSPGQS
jgi:hypothetical protein